MRAPCQGASSRITTALVGAEASGRGSSQAPGWDCVWLTENFLQFQFSDIFLSPAPRGEKIWGLVCPSKMGMKSSGSCLQEVSKHVAAQMKSA